MFITMAMLSCGSQEETMDNSGNPSGSVQSTASSYTIVEYYATWCGYCSQFAPVLDKFEDSNPDISVVRKDIDSYPAEVEKNSIFSVPTLIFYDNNAEVARNSGYMSLDILQDWVDGMTD